MCSMDSISGECRLLRSGRENLVSASRNAVRVRFGILANENHGLLLRLYNASRKIFRTFNCALCCDEKFRIRRSCYQLNHRPFSLNLRAFAKIYVSW